MRPSPRRALLPRTVRLRRERLPGRKPQFPAAKRPVHPYKSATQNRVTVENAKGASTPREGADGEGHVVNGARPWLAHRAEAQLSGGGALVFNLYLL